MEFTADGMIGILILILLVENGLFFFFLMPNGQGKKPTKTELRQFIQDHPDMFDSDILEMIVNIVEARMRQPPRRG